MNRPSITDAMRPTFDPEVYAVLNDVDDPAFTAKAVERHRLESKEWPAEYQEREAKRRRDARRQDTVFGLVMVVALLVWAMSCNRHPETPQTMQTISREGR